MRRPALTIGVSVVISGMVLAVADARSPRLRLTGGASSAVVLCGVQRDALVVAEGARVVARVTRPGHRVASLTIERCQAGAFKDRKRIKLGRARTSVIDTSAVGDYRVRARAGGRRSRPAYLRVGVGEIVELTVGFAVKNVNRSKLSCALNPPDGKDYTLIGELVAPASVLSWPRPPVTIWVHGTQWPGRFIQRYRGLPGADLAYEMAKLGHATLAYDRLGFGASSIPPGLDVCTGSQADTLHQLIEQLRAGSYAVEGRRTPRFRRVAIAGHSGGGPIAEAEAYSFSDIDALILMGFADQGFTPLWYERGLPEPLTQCPQGAEPKGPGLPSGYVHFFERGMRTLFYDAPPKMVEDFVAHRERDPCGDLAGAPEALALAPLQLPTVTVPVLIIDGDHDSVYLREGIEAQALHYRGSDNVTVEIIKDAGHIFFIERKGPESRAVISRWLKARGF